MTNGWTNRPNILLNEYSFRQGLWGLQGAFYLSYERIFVNQIYCGTGRILVELHEFQSITFMPSQPASAIVSISPRSPNEHESRSRVRAHDSNELFFGMVGHVGAGTSLISTQLEELLRESGYESCVLKARDEITDWAKNNSLEVPQPPVNSLDKIKRLQDLGDQMRAAGDHAAVAAALALRIRATRARYLNQDPKTGEPIRPDGTKRAYILDSLRHPEEVRLLQRLYSGAFTLIGVVSAEEVRRSRLVEKYEGADAKSAGKFMFRDEGTMTEKHGQHVAAAFELADFYLDNSEPRKLDQNRSNPSWDIPDQLSRLLKIITSSGIQRPTPEETAMHAAHGAKLRSACLSRQVGASITDAQGAILAVGTNEVPRSGGGVYGEGGDTDSSFDGRCFALNKYCSNTQAQNEIIDELLYLIDETRNLPPERRGVLRDELRKSGVGQLLEFSRSVHAEVAALLASGRQGKSTAGTRMFVTTYPCHYCARSIIAAGVREVQYIEPYPKSQALHLHSDAMTALRNDPNPPAGIPRVLIRPFTGVSPTMYERAYLKDRDLKDKTTGTMEISDAPWGSAWELPSLSYVELEAKLAELKSAESRVESTVVKNS